jgi:hypothetical protein
MKPTQVGNHHQNIPQNIHREANINIPQRTLCIEIQESLILIQTVIVLIEHPLHTTKTSNHHYRDIPHVIHQEANTSIPQTTHSTEVTVGKERDTTPVLIITTHQKGCVILDQSSMSPTIAGRDHVVGLERILKALQRRDTDQEVVKENIEAVREEEIIDQEVHQHLLPEVHQGMVDGRNMVEREEEDTDHKAHQADTLKVPHVKPDLEAGYMIDTKEQKLDQEVTLLQVGAIIVCLGAGLGHEVGQVYLLTV